MWSLTVYFETALSSARACSIWSYAYVAMAESPSSCPCGRAIRRFGRRGHLVGGDRGAELGDRRCYEGTERETGDGGRRFVAFEPVEEGSEHSQGDTRSGGVGRVVVVADRHSEVLERGQRVAVFGLKPGEDARQVGRVGAVAARLRTSKDVASPA
jgi:hypothetical protein